jgi:hypothetical protein
MRLLSDCRRTPSFVSAKLDWHGSMGPMIGTNWPIGLGHLAAFDSRRIIDWIAPAHSMLLTIETASTLHGAMPNRSHPHAMSLRELSERAEGYAALARDGAADETRQTFERLAREYADMASERKAAEKSMTRH